MCGRSVAQSCSRPQRSPHVGGNAAGGQEAKGWFILADGQPSIAAMLQNVMILGCSPLQCQHGIVAVDGVRAFCC